MFPEQLFADHIDLKLTQIHDVLQKHGKDAAIIPAGVPQPVYWDDNYYPFKANFHFSLFVPVGPLPNSYLIISKGEQPTLVYYQPADYWHVVPDDPDPAWAKHFAIHVVRTTDEWTNYVPNNSGTTVWLGEPEAEASDICGVENINPNAVVHELHYYRAVKTDYEIDRLAEANLWAAKGHIAAKEAFLAGGTELDIHVAYLKATRHTEAELPYGNIIALGPHSAVLHYTELEKTLPELNQRQSFLIDAGAKANHYCSDITRTWSTDDQFIEMISEFDLLQQDLIAEIKPGLDYVELHKATHLRIAEYMVKHDILNVSAEEAVANNITATFYPHGLGHLLGLQVHDIGGHQQNIAGDTKSPPAEHPFLRLTRTLEAGYCVTIEPGMYFIDLLMDQLRATEHGKAVNWNRVSELKHFGGIRIEDDVIVTEFGYQNLSRQAFQSVTAEQA